MNEGFQQLQDFVAKLQSVKSPDDMEDCREKVVEITKKILVKDILEYMQFLSVKREIPVEQMLEVSSNILFNIATSVIEDDALEAFFNELNEIYLKNIQEIKGSAESAEP